MKNTFMKHTFTSALCLTVLATLVSADTRLADIKTNADQLKKESERVALLLKAKQPDAQAIREGITAMGGEIETLDGLVVQITEASPEFVLRGSTDWDLLKMQVQLLSVFHNAKAELMNADDMKKNRSTLRAYAEGLATRAGSLRQTAQRLQR